MKTIFSRVLLAQFVVVVLALAVAAAITRANLYRGFEEFLDRQETTVLQNLAPVLGEFYQRRGGWSALHSNPAVWQTIWRIGMTGEAARIQRPQAGARRPPPAEREASPRGPGVQPGPGADLRWPGRPGRGGLRERLFLLDEQRALIVGAAAEEIADELLEPIVVDGETVGWIGFSPMGNILPPEAQLFVRGQLKVMALALAVALAVAALLSWALARTVSRPVRNIGSAVRRLSGGDYETRADTSSGGEIAVLAGHVNQLAESLDRNRTARRRWMADIAHELRTPVAVIKGEIEAMVDGVRAVDDSTLGSLREEAEHLAMMVDDLQILALSDAGALDIKKKETDLSELVALAGNSFEPRLSERRITLQTEIAERCALACDAHRMRQLLHNLLENCCRYTEDGGTVRLGLECGDSISLIVEDSGPGVDDDQLQCLFERFYRAEHSRARATGGSGLGLAICRNIAEAHGGSITAAHSPTGGLSIRTSLPF
ncbi:MAG: ATP-binding protein [Lysobacterales bacterium]|jgi:two-component system sensor histidine kinase BaeS